MDLKGAVIAVIGLGYVGLPLAVEFGKKRRVIGFDIDESRVEELKGGHDRTMEINRSELVSAKLLELTSSLSAIQEASVFIVTVPTPVDSSNRPDLSHLIDATEKVARVLKPSDVVIYESTVFPGAIEEICAPLIETLSGLKYFSTTSIKGDSLGFYCAYSPERINPGDKDHTLIRIRKVTSGSTPEVAEAVDNLYKEIVIAGTYKASSIKVAEAAKIIENAQRDLNIAFVNELSIIFNLMEIDSNEVLDAAATKWNFLPFRPGLVGGHCIGVDPYYLTYKSNELGYLPQVILAGRKINDEMGFYVAREVVRLMIRNGMDISKCSVGILGVTFKENCTDVRNSKVVDLINEFKQWGLKVIVMDPWADPLKVREEHDILLSEITPKNQVDALVVAVKHHEFLALTPLELRSLCKSNFTPVIADLKACYDKSSLEALGFTVFRL